MYVCIYIYIYIYISVCMHTYLCFDAFLLSFSPFKNMKLNGTLFGPLVRKPAGPTRALAEFSEFLTALQSSTGFFMVSMPRGVGVSVSGLRGFILAD